MSKYEQAFNHIKPLVEAIADWEREHGTAAAVYPFEYDDFMRVFKQAMIRSSPRAAMEIIDA